MAAPALLQTSLRQSSALRSLLALEPVAGSAAAWVQAFEGPAIWFDPTGVATERNISSQCLGMDDGLDTGVMALVDGARSGRAPQARQIELEDPSNGPRRIDLIALPHLDGVLVLGRETSLDARRIASLSQARALFRDVAACAGGFAFEVDAHGLFQWTFGNEALGYRPDELMGRRARDFLAAAQGGDDPFAVRSDQDRRIVWLQSCHQGPRAMETTMRPVFGPAGTWRGVRGHAVDVTEALRAQRRERLSARLVDALRSSTDPHEILTAAVSALADGCGVAAAWLIARDRNLQCAATPGAPPCDLLMEIAGRTMADASDAPVLFSSGDWSGLAIPLRAQGAAAGAALIGKPTADGVIDREAMEVLRAVAPMLSLGLLQARAMAALQVRHNGDPSTGMMDRAAFTDTLQRRGALRGALIIVSCEHFKVLSDCLGHAAAAELAQEISQMLRAQMVQGDLCARLGGGDFAVWAHGVAEVEMAARIDAVRAGFRTVSRRMSLALAVTPVIGAVIAPLGETTVEDLFARAHAAQEDDRRRPAPRRRKPAA